MPLRLLGYCETNATAYPTEKKTFEVNNISKLIDIWQSTFLNEEISISNIKNDSKRNTDYFTKTRYFKQTFQYSNYTSEQQKLLTRFKFQHSQINQQEFDLLAELLLKYPMIYASSKFDVGKINSPLQLPLKPHAFFKKQRARKVSSHLKDKVNRLLDILEQYEIISSVTKEKQPKQNLHKPCYQSR